MCPIKCHTSFNVFLDLYKEHISFVLWSMCFTTDISWLVCNKCDAIYVACVWQELDKYGNTGHSIHIFQQCGTCMFRVCYVFSVCWKGICHTRVTWIYTYLCKSFIKVIISLSLSVSPCVHLFFQDWRLWYAHMLNKLMCCVGRMNEHCRHCVFGRYCICFEVMFPWQAKIIN